MRLNSVRGCSTSRPPSWSGRAFMSLQTPQSPSPVLAERIYCSLMAASSAAFHRQVQVVLPVHRVRGPPPSLPPVTASLRHLSRLGCDLSCFGSRRPFFRGFGLQRMGQQPSANWAAGLLRVAAVRAPAHSPTHRAAFHRAQRLRHCQVALHTARIQLRLQGLNLGIFGRSRLCNSLATWGLRQRHRTALVLLSQFQPTRNCAAKSASRTCLRMSA